jgi:ubiquinone/menaquinone biosynthesis C-methylase UbiE
MRVRSISISKDQFALESYQNYYKKTEQTKSLERLITPYLRPGTNVLDACCGGGEATYFLSQLQPQATFLAIDNYQAVIEEAQRQCPSSDNVKFQIVDVNQLTSIYGEKAFDLVVCMKTISWLPSYEEAMKNILSVARKHVFLSSLFYDGWIDFEIKVKEHAKPWADFSWYNIYSFPRFVEFCNQNRAKRVIDHGFIIGIDLPKPDNPDLMGTYTIRQLHGDRLQVSGALLMPWKIVQIDM